jgi:hypothetical protein
MDDRSSHGLVYSETQRPMEADILLSTYKVAIEFQGEHHYYPDYYNDGLSGLRKRRKQDREKRRVFKEAGYLMIEISYETELTPPIVLELLKSKAKRHPNLELRKLFRKRLEKIILS